MQSETKSEQIVFRTWPTYRRLLEQEAEKKGVSVASIMNAAVRTRYARKLKANGNGARP